MDGRSKLWPRGDAGGVVSWDCRPPARSTFTWSKVALNWMEELSDCGDMGSVTSMLPDGLHAIELAIESERLALLPCE